jgi:hypothetical protein
MPGTGRREPQTSQRDANYRATDRYRRCWNCAHFVVPAACLVVEGTILADHTCDLWAEDWGGTKSRTGFRAGRRKYQDPPWAAAQPFSELRPAEPPLDPGTFLCLGCAEELLLASRSLVLPSCPSCGDSRWLAL